MKTLLCAIAKLENHYIEEWIMHYKKLGISKIVLYDNNSLESEYSEKLSDVQLVKDEIENGFIDLYEVFDEYKPQLKCYNECYAKYSQEYDWFMFFDIDEYLMLERFVNIDDFLNQDIFKPYELIHIPWKLFDDNDLIHIKNNDYSLVNRFTRPIEVKQPNKFKLNQEIKSIVRGHLNKDVRFTNTPHTINSVKLKCCNPSGRRDDALNQKTKLVYHKGAWLNHYICKSLEEYLNIKKMRGGGITPATSSRYKTHFYFIYNVKTIEKIQYIKEITNEDIKMTKKVVTSPCNFISTKTKIQPNKPALRAGLNKSIKKPKIGNTDIKVAVCCIIKMENHYILEWAKYYKKLGVDNIILYDNNDVDGPIAENIRDIPEIAEMIDSGFIIHHKIPGESVAQVKYYTQCYKDYGEQYDWIMFFDIDEFLTIDPNLECNNVKEYLALEIYDKFNMIHLNWKIYDDNNLIRVVDNDYSIQSRFTRELSTSFPNKNYLNKEIKSIVRGHLKNIKFVKNPHTCEGTGIVCCNALGQTTLSNVQKSQIVVHKYAWINHYICKTIEEYIHIKMVRKGGHTKHEKGLRYSLNFFFTYNKRTAEKINYIKSLVNTNVLSQDVVEYESKIPAVKKVVNSPSPVRKISYSSNIIKKTIQPPNKISSLYKSK